MQVRMKVLALPIVILAFSESRRSVEARAEPVKIGKARELFVDDHLVDQMSRLSRTYHPVKKYEGNPVLVADRPWEAFDVYLKNRKEGTSKPSGKLMTGQGGRVRMADYGGWVLLYGTVLFDEEEKLFKMWYFTVAEFGKETECVQCYATSKDGIRWEKPNLGLVEYQGSTANNIVIRQSTAQNFDECFCVIKDKKEADSQRRYKSIFWCREHGDYPHALWTATSPDGIHWRLSEAPALSPAADATSFFYDEFKNRYVAVPRPLDDQISKAVSFSEDFQTWTAMQTVLRPLAEKEKAGMAREQIYNMYPFCYESLYLGIAQVYYWHPHWALVGEWVFSRDCLNWVRPEPWRAHLPVGGPGEFDRMNNSFSSGPPIRVGDKLYFYYSGRSYRHREYHRYEHGQKEKDSGPWEAAIGLAMLRLDGFASIDAPFGPDRYLTTKPLLYDGNTLHVNAKCDWGYIRVELQDEAGNAIQGFSAESCNAVRANGTDLKVTWKQGADIGIRAGKATRLRFVMENAQLYSFWVD